MTDTLSDLTTALEQAAVRLRQGELSADDAAETVERCARLAADAGAALDREARAAAQLPLSRSEQLPLTGSPGAAES